MLTTNNSGVSNVTFDFVIAGGGTAGLALAARLSEDPSVTVVVLEAGENTIGDPVISVPAQFGRAIGNPKYDWTFLTTKQSHSHNRQLLWSRGKGLGGSSGINFYAWIKPPIADVDAFEQLGNTGWNWPEFMRYTIKAEHFHPPTDEQADLYPHTYDTTVRGTTGPIQSTITPHAHTVHAVVSETLVNMGIPELEEPYKGNINGTFTASANLDPSSWSRSYSASAYLLPAQDRPNLTVLSQTLVTRVIFADVLDGAELVATGLEFIQQGSQYVVNARREVILSAGTIKDPQILELSGIGRQEVLDRIGVDVKVHLPGVGENLQDHNFFGVTYELNSATGHQTLDLLRNSEYAREAMRQYTEGKGMMRTGLTSFTYFPLSSIKTESSARVAKQIEKEIQEYKNTPGIAPGLSEQLDIQLASLHDDTVPEVEVIGFPGMFMSALTPEPGKRYISLIGIINHPISRGTIHAITNDPNDNLDIDPHCFEKAAELCLEIFKWIRSMSETEPLKSDIIGPELQPGPDCVTDEHIREFIRETQGSAWHAIGTCSMLPRDKQGVVDPQLKVYGTKNVRVVDLSIVPLHIAAHTQTMAYMIAEKAADIIKSAYTSTHS